MTIQSKKIQISKLCQIVVCFLLAFILISFFPLSKIVYASDKCTNNYQKASNMLLVGNFDLIISLLDSCVIEKRYADLDTLIDAHELLAIAFIGKDQLKNAEKIIKKLLNILPEYTPKRPMDKKYMDLVKKEKRKRRVVRAIIGGSMLATTVGIIIITYPEQPPEEKLPDPPQIKFPKK